MACIKPSPSSPNNASSGTKQSSKIISAVSEALIPSLFSFFPPLKPGVPRSTMKAEIPRLSNNSPVRASTTATSPDIPCVIQFLAPLITQPPSTFFATVFIRKASLPVFGSVSPQAPRNSPVASFGRYFFFCSSLAK